MIKHYIILLLHHSEETQRYYPITFVGHPPTCACLPRHRYGLGPFADREIDSVLQIVLAAHGHDVLAHARVVLYHMRTDLCRGRATANRTRYPLRRRMPCKCFPHAQPCHRTIATARTSDISNCHCNSFFQHWEGIRTQPFKLRPDTWFYLHAK